MSEAIRKNLYRYHEAQLQLDAAGGPEHDAVLFELLIELQENILASFGLPAAQKHIKKLWKFANRDITEESIDKTISLLHRAAEKHLLSPVSTPVEVLAKAEKSQSSAYNVLPELGYITHDYFIFIYHELLLTGKASPKEILDEMETVRRLDCYAELYHLKHTPEPEFDVNKVFDALSNELRFLELYLQPPQMPDWVYDDDEETEGKPFGPAGIASSIMPEPDVVYDFMRDPFEVQEIIFSPDSGITLFGRFKLEHGFRDIMLGCEHENLAALLEQYPLGQAILPEIQLRPDQPESDEPIIINLKDQFGTTLSFTDHFLEIGQALSHDVPDNFYFLSEAISKDQYEAQDKAEAQLLELYQRYITFIELQQHGLNKTEARKAGSLEDDELFKTARLLYEFVKAGGKLEF